MSKGAYKYSDQSGAKCMSKSHGVLKSAQGKMNSSHGVVPKNTHNNMDQGGTNQKIGQNCRGFKHGIPGEAGPVKPIVGHSTKRGVERE